MRLLKVRMLDGAIKSMMVDDSQIVTNMMVIICTKIGITNHDEYSLVREKVEEEQENVTPNKKYGTLGGTLTLGRTHKKHTDPNEPVVDPKMATLRKNLHTEDGGRSFLLLPSRLAFSLAFLLSEGGRKRWLLALRKHSLELSQRHLALPVGNVSGCNLLFLPVNWVDHSKTLREQGVDEAELLLLRRKYFYSDANVDARLNNFNNNKNNFSLTHDLMFFRDPVQLNLLYEQAKEAILEGTHPVRLEDAIQFAALQVQIQFGDHKEDKHKVGMLAE